MADFNSLFGIGDHVSYINPNNGGLRAPKQNGTVVAVRFARNGAVAFSVLSDTADIITQNISSTWVTPFVVEPPTALPNPNQFLSEGEEDAYYDPNISETRPVMAKF